MYPVLDLTKMLVINNKCYFIPRKRNIIVCDRLLMECIGRPQHFEHEFAALVLYNV